MSRRRRMHGKRRRKSSCAPFKHTISMRVEDQHAHSEDGTHPEDKTVKPANTVTEARANLEEAKHQQYLETQPSIKQETGEPYKEPKDSGDLFEGLFQYGSDDPAKSIQGRLLGETGTHEKERVKTQEFQKDVTQVGASVVGVANPYADVANIKMSVDRAKDALFGLTRPQSFSDAWTHTKGAAFNTMALAPLIGDYAGVGYNMARLGGKSPGFVKGGKDIVKSLTGKGSIWGKSKRSVLDAVGTVGNWEYWFNKDTGTFPGIIKLATGEDEFSWLGKKELDKPKSKPITYPEKNK